MGWRQMVLEETTRNKNIAAESRYFGGTLARACEAGLSLSGRDGASCESPTLYRSAGEFLRSRTFLHDWWGAANRAPSGFVTLSLGSGMRRRVLEALSALLFDLQTAFFARKTPSSFSSRV